MRLKKTLFISILAIFHLFILCGCTTKPELVGIDALETAISENDLIHVKFGNTPDNITIDKRKTKYDEGSDEVWVTAETDCGNFKYLSSYILNYSLYDINSNKEWSLDEIKVEKRNFIPNYNYNGLWVAPDSYYIDYYIQDIDWEKGTCKLNNELYSLEPYVEDNYGTIDFGWVRYNENGAALKFYFDDVFPDSPLPFKVIISDDEAIRVSPKDINDTRDLQYDFLQDASFLEIKTKEGIVITDGNTLMTSGEMGGGNNATSGVQIDFNYGIEEMFSPYLGQEVDIYSFGIKVGSTKIDEIDPFVSMVLVVGDNAEINEDDMDSFCNALSIHEGVY